MALLVEALNILLSGIWSLWIVSGLKINLHLWGMIITIFSKIQGWRKILNYIFSLNHDDILPLSLKCIASTSDAIFWRGILAPLYPVVQPIKDVFGSDRKRCSERTKCCIYALVFISGAGSGENKYAAIHWKSVLKSFLHRCQGCVSVSRRLPCSKAGK